MRLDQVKELEVLIPAEEPGVLPGVGSSPSLTGSRAMFANFLPQIPDLTPDKPPPLSSHTFSGKICTPVEHWLAGKFIAADQKHF